MAVTAPKVVAGPRISANELALFMVSSDTSRISIVRRSKYPQKPPIIRYARIREPIRTFLSDPVRKVNPLVTAEQMLQQLAADPSQKQLAREDARLSIEVLHALQAMSNKLASFDFYAAPQKQPKLTLSGVTVSAHADLMLRAATKGKQQYGAAILRMTQDDADTDGAKSKRSEMGQYVATLARLHAEANLGDKSREIANKLCLSIDVQHREVFQAPASSSRRISNLQSACIMIAALWPTV